jgi:hypothetical protein
MVHSNFQNGPIISSQPIQNSSMISPPFAPSNFPMNNFPNNYLMQNSQSHISMSQNSQNKAN